MRIDENEFWETINKARYLPFLYYHYQQNNQRLRYLSVEELGELHESVEKQVYYRLIRQVKKTWWNGRYVIVPKQLKKDYLLLKKNTQLLPLDHSMFLVDCS